MASRPPPATGSVPAMAAQSILLRHLRNHGVHKVIYRSASSMPRPKHVAPKVAAEPEPPLKYSKPVPERSWLTEKVKASPTAKRLFLGLATLLGYSSTKQIAARRSRIMYQQLCVPRAGEERKFWQESMCNIASNLTRSSDTIDTPPRQIVDYLPHFSPGSL